MSTLEDWLVAVQDALELPGPAERDLVLDLARDVAHGVARPAAPLTSYLLGVAVGRGMDPAVAARRVTDLARGWSPPAE